MKILQISSGLGNQMFQYALYKSLCTMYDETFLDISTSYKINKNQHNGYELETVFNIKPNIANDLDIAKLSDINNDFFSKFKRKMFGQKSSMYKEIDEYMYDPKVFTKNNIYLKGYWQNINYFRENSGILLNDFTFRNNLDGVNKILSMEIVKENSVSIHIRRGDYYANSLFTKKFGNIANVSYYKEAIKIINSQVNNPKFYIFSDDINWAKDNLNLSEECTFVTHNTKNDNYIDMQLMSLCKHNIIANSSFSWWASYLNKNLNKIVIAPEKWVNIKMIGRVDLFPKGWITL